MGLIACADAEKSLFAKSTIGLDLFYEALVFDTRTVNGAYRTINHASGMTFRLNF